MGSHRIRCSQWTNTETNLGLGSLRGVKAGISFQRYVLSILGGGDGQHPLWDDIQKQRQQGGYPWTHLSHDQDAEVWIDPAALPADISR